MSTALTHPVISGASPEQTGEENGWAQNIRGEVVLNGIMFVWFLLTGPSVLFVGVDIRSTPESPVLKWGFILLTAYTGPVGAFLYVLGCREPLPGTHEQYVNLRWRQVLGSTMHCVAGDGVGILAGAVIGAIIHLPRLAEIGLEYLLGFGFGWTIFQALFMRDMAGGSYRNALGRTFISELLSMNWLMAGMVSAMTFAMMALPGSHSPRAAAFWFVMSMALLTGFITAYPVNWWLVAKGLKHGMMTIRPMAREKDPKSHRGSSMHEQVHAQPHQVHDSGHSDRNSHPNATVGLMAALSFLALAIGLGVAAFLGGFR